MTFDRVIVAFDGSPESGDALALALRLREPTHGVLTLAHVVSGARWHVGPQVHRPDAAVPDEIAFLFANARASSIASGIHVRERAPIAPSPAFGLSELAETEASDLIVIGSSQHGEAGRIRLERTAGRLLQGAPCAVAIAPSGLREADAFRHIGVAYDGSLEARAALSVAYDIATRCAAAMSLIYALPEIGPDDLRRDARLHAEADLGQAAAAAPEGVNPRTMLLDGAAAEVVRGASDGIVDLLVTGSRSYGPMHRALLGSVSESLTEGAASPVLVVPRRPTCAGAVQSSTPHALEAP